MQKMRSEAKSTLRPMMECIQSKLAHREGVCVCAKVVNENESRGSHVSNGFFRLTNTHGNMNKESKILLLMYFKREKE